MDIYAQIREELEKEVMAKTLAARTPSVKPKKDIPPGLKNKIVYYGQNSSSERAYFMADVVEEIMLSLGKTEYVDFRKNMEDIIRNGDKISKVYEPFTMVFLEKDWSGYPKNINKTPLLVIDGKRAKGIGVDGNLIAFNSEPEMTRAATDKEINNWFDSLDGNHLITMLTLEYTKAIVQKVLKKPTKKTNEKTTKKLLETQEVGF